MSSPLSMSRPCSLSHQPQWWSLQTRLPGGCHPPQWPPGGSWNVTNVICENDVMKVTALPDNGPSSSWGTSSIFSRMMEPWIFGTCYGLEIFSFTENLTTFQRILHYVYWSLKVNNKRSATPVYWKNWSLETYFHRVILIRNTDACSEVLCHLIGQKDSTLASDWSLLPPGRRSRSRRRGTVAPRRSTGPRGKTGDSAGKSGKMSTPDLQLN